jgi:hypothetical protein
LSHYVGGPQTRRCLCCVPSSCPPTAQFRPAWNDLRRLPSPQHLPQSTHLPSSLTHARLKRTLGRTGQRAAALLQPVGSMHHALLGAVLSCSPTAGTTERTISEKMDRSHDRAQIGSRDSQRVTPALLPQNAHNVLSTAGGGASQSACTTSLSVPLDVV